MKVLLDEFVPRKLRREITSHEVRTVTESGWSGLKNEALFALAKSSSMFPHRGSESDFSAESTTVQRRNYSDGCAKHRCKTLLPLMSEVNAAIEDVKRGELVRIGGG